MGREGGTCRTGEGCPRIDGGRHPKRRVGGEGGRMSELLMVRHGQASFPAENDDVLSERGCAQAEVLGRYWLRVGLTADAIYAGDLVRQRETAGRIREVWAQEGQNAPECRIDPSFNEYDSKNLILACLEDLLREDPRLSREIDSIRKDKKAFQRLFDRIIRKWQTGGIAREGVMPWETFRETVQKGLRRVMAQEGRGRRVLIFTSGGPIAVAVQFALDLTDAQTIRLGWQIANTAVTRFLYDDERLTLASFNGIPHLELQRDPEWITYR